MERRISNRTVRVRLVLCTLFFSGCADSQPEKSLYGDMFASSDRHTRLEQLPQEGPLRNQPFEEESGGTGTQMAEAEGQIGQRESTRATGQFAMKNNNSAPQLARALATAREAGVLGALGHDHSSGIDDRDVYGGLLGNEVGEMAGGWGYGISGMGPGGGCIGCENWGTIGAAAKAPVAPVPNTEAYQDYGFNRPIDPTVDALSTFAIDVDTASYSIFRRKRRDGVEVPAASIRTEEFLNYFRYHYAAPTDGRAFAVHLDAAPSPFSTKHHLLRVGVQGKRIAKSERKNAHLVFLVDVSGSMTSPDKLSLAQKALRILVDNLSDGDTVGLVTYAGNVREVLQPTGLDNRAQILGAIEDLSAGGSTAMGSGIELAYNMAAKNLGPDSLSRVIVLSDGDANVGRTGHEGILKTIRAQVKEGVTLSAIGFGMGNYKDTLMEQLANKGNGNYYYVDGLAQARRIFQENLGATLEVIAKDVKIQVEFDPKQVKSYRLLGYENRDVADRDFRNDRVDAGELGAGHTVTALYEIELAETNDAPLVTVRLRAKKPRGEKAVESVFELLPRDLLASFAEASDDFRFAVAVMAGAEILRDNPRSANWKISQAILIAKNASAEAKERHEFVELLR